MTNTNVFHDEVLGYISAIDDAVMESEMAVTLSLMEAADKAMMIMENYEGEFIDSFSVFQEAAGNGKDPAHPFKEDTVLKTIIMFIPNLFKLIIAKLNKIFNKDERTKFEKAMDALKKSATPVADLINSIVDAVAENKEKVIIAGIPISLAVLGIATGAFKKAYTSATKAMRDYFKKADPSIKDLEDVDVKLVKGGEAIKTHLDIDAFGNWFASAAKFMIEYNGAIAAKNVDAITSALNKLDSLMNKYHSKKGFTNGKAQVIPADDFRKSYAEVTKACGEFKAAYDINTSNPNKADSWNKAGPVFEAQTANVEKWTKLSTEFQQILVAFANLVDSHAAEFEGIEEDLNTVSKKFGFSGIIDGAKNLMSKIKAKFGGDKSADSGEKKTADSDASDGSVSPKPTETPGPGGDEDVAESAKITIVDEDYVQEGVTRTGKTAKVEETAETAGDVEKLIKKYISNVSKKGFSNEKKMLLIIGDSKIKYDKGKIQKPGKDETWDDVDMSAHDRVDNVKLYISGAGALAYAKKNNIGKAKQIQESVLPEEDNEPEETVTVESVDTSWYN